MLSLLLAVCGIVVTSEACGPPEAVENAEVQGGSNRTAWHHGDTVTYTCSQQGMLMQGSSKHRTCINGTWTKPKFVCERKTCIHLDPPIHGRRLTTNEPTVHVVAYFACNEGYTMRGLGTLLCLASGQWRPEMPPTCHPVMCPEPEDVANGSKFQEAPDGVSNVYSSVVTYTCDQYYHPEGQTRRRCQAYGQWEGVAPSCIPFSCPRIELEHGSVEYSGQPITIHTSAVISCDKYADIDPPDASRVICLDDETWSKTAHCRRQAIITTLNKGRIQTRPGSDWLLVENGTRLRHGTEIRQACFSRYELYRDGYLNLYFTKLTNNNGHWEPRMASCKEKRCEVPPVANGTPKLSDGSTARGKVEHGATVSTVCDARFELDPTSDASARCLYGQLQLNDCVGKKCHTASIPGVETLDIYNNGVKLSVGTTIENRENVSVQCGPGFDPNIDYEEPYVMFCDYGDWSKELTCTPKKCHTANISGVESLDILYNGVQLPVGMNVENRGIVSVKCKPGFDPSIYYAEPYVMLCDHGDWSKELTCTPKKCHTASIPGVETLDIYNNGVKLSVGTTIENRENVSVKCGPGFDPNIYYAEPYVMFCDYGDWSKELTCTPKKCHTANIPGVETLDIFYNGVQQPVGMNVENRETVSVKCKSGYDRDIENKDPYVMTCDHGDWSKELTCTPRSCVIPDIPNTKDSEVMNNIEDGVGVKHDEQMEIVCKEGYVLADETGRTNLTCMFGNWTSLPPECLEKLEQSGSANNAVIAGASAVGVASIVLLAVVCYVRKRVRQKKEPKHADSIDNKETLRANDYGKIDKTLRQANRRADLQTEHQHHTYENIGAEEPGVNMHGDGLQTERQSNIYVNMDTGLPRAVGDKRKGSQTERQTNSYVDMDVEFPRAGGDMRKYAQSGKPLISRDKRRGHKPMYVNTKF